MAYNLVPLQRLVEQFERLPGIGSKSAQRLAYHILNLDESKVKEFAIALTDAHEKIKYCDECCNLSEDSLCPVCKSVKRDRTTICIVESPRDAMAIEDTNEYHGLYHVLHGVISPLEGKGPDDLTLKKLLTRLNSGEVSEIIMATNPTVEGEATAMYISRLLKPMGIKITRLAYGIPVGGDLEYTDGMTLVRALAGRSEF